jgi:predicted permease
MLWPHRLRYLMKGIRLRFRFLFMKGAAEEEMEEEIRFHLDEEIRRNLAQGMDPSEARRLAHLHFGGVEQIKEKVRGERGTRPLEEVAEDSRFALRQLRKTPVFTAVAVLTLALGIGANTSIFSLVNGALLKKRPFQDAATLVNIYTEIQGLTPYATAFTADLADLRSLEDVFAEVAAYRGTASRIQEADGARLVLAEAVTANLFPMVGLEPALGRGFIPEEDSPGSGERVAILGHGLWMERYGGDPGVLGSTIRLAGIPHTVVGVAPASLESFTSQSFRAGLYIPLATSVPVADMGLDHTSPHRGTEGLKIMARLRTGMGIHQAQARAHGLVLGLREDFPQEYRERSFNLYPAAGVAMQPDVDAHFMKIALLLMAAMAMVLLLATTNLAGSLLARGLDRGEEIALRLALGAGRGRIIRQLITESMILALLGTAAGLILGRWTLDLLASLAPPSPLPISIDTGMDFSVFLFTLGVTGGAALLAGAGPALHSTRPELSPILRGAGGTDILPRGRVQKGLVALQVAMSMILLVTGGLFVRSLQEAREMDPGFGARDTGMVWMDLAVGGVPMADFETAADELVARARALPGVEEVAVSNGVPLSESTYMGQFHIPGTEPPPGEESHTAPYFTVSEGFLSLMDIPLVAGRGIRTSDRTGTEGVVVVSEAAARRFWPGKDPLGKTVETVDSEQSFRVVGVTRDTRVVNYREGPTPLLYFPRHQYARRGDQLWLLGRGRDPAPQTAAALRRLVTAVNPELVVLQTETMAEHLSAALALPRMAALFMGFFGILALVLASLGLYGLVSFGASRRTREVGVRMSLGAGMASVTRMVVREGLTPVCAGTLLGLCGAVVLARFAGRFLIGVSPLDPTTLLGVPLLLLAVSAVAAWLPARRAARVDPVKALRPER